MRIIIGNKLFETEECTATETFRSPKGTYFEVFRRPFRGARIISESEAFNRCNKRTQASEFKHLKLEQG